jgi:predicted metal-dependent peptidase
MDLMKRLSKAKTSLILEHPFIGSVALGMPMSLSTEVPTAATNGKRVLYNPEFIEPLTDEELKFLVAHECMHPMLEHNYRRGARDPKKWNKAADFVINQLLVDEGIGKFIEGGCLDKTIYTNGGGTSDGIYSLLPDSDDGDGDGDGSGGIGNDLEDGEGDQAQQAQEAAEWKIKVAQAAQAAKMMGKLSANMARLVDEILTPKVNWRDVLQRFVQKAKNDQRSFARPNRRFLSQGLYMPTVTGEVLGELVFAVDMSGSIGQDECDQFSAECRTVFEDGRPEKLHLIFFSHEVCAHDTIERDGDFVFNARGGGGTAFSPVFKHIEEQGIDPAAIVFLTDLCCSDFGDQPDCPVLWVSTYEGTAPFGEVVMM